MCTLVVTCAVVMALAALLALAGAWHHAAAGNLYTAALLAALGGENLMLAIAAWQERPQRGSS